MLIKNLTMFKIKVFKWLNLKFLARLKRRARGTVLESASDKKDFEILVRDVRSMSLTKTDSIYIV